MTGEDLKALRLRFAELEIEERTVVKYLSMAGVNLTNAQAAYDKLTRQHQDVLGRKEALLADLEEAFARSDAGQAQQRGLDGVVRDGQGNSEGI